MTQNVNLTATCINRGGAAFTTWPKSAVVIPPSTAAGPKNCVWLKVLNVSSLSCRAFDSLRRIDLSSARSKFKVPGPWKERRDALPGVPKAFRLNADALK